MKKYDVLKIVIILQALGMVALAVVVMWSYFPYMTTREDNNDTQQIPVSGADKDEVIAVIADQEITKQQLVEELLELYGDQGLEQMLIHRAIEMAAKEQGISLSSSELAAALAEASSGYESEEQYFTAMKDQLGLSQNRVLADIRDHALLLKIASAWANIDEAQIDDYLRQHQAELEPKQRLNLSWILCSTNDDANMVLMMLKEGASFAELASQFSLDPYSAELGGSLGEIDSDDPFYDSALLDEAMRLEIGDIVGPIETSEGYAIIQLLGREKGKTKNEQQQREWARTQLALEQIGSLSEVKQQLLNEYVTVIRK
ncbi:peptidylprolyl isomerase [Paenibacillus septentrionalis]|uniref:peptidylprolyl isomerase n=1 Tax=Paenibacillus septentrionalis TaxID=429342 RepID=A0ABW1VCA5_9BACL